MNFLEKTIEFFSPSTALERAKQRMMLRAYEGARRDRRTMGWITGTNNNDTLLRDLPLLKQRSEDLYDNDPHAFSAHTTIYQSVVGTGILPAIKDAQIKQAWTEWADSVYCDFDEDLNLYGIQALAVQTMSIHGGVLILRVKTDSKNNRLPLELKVLATSFLDTTKDTFAIKDGKYVKGGIEFNSKGKKTGYWIYDADPTEFATVQSTFWKAEDVIHLFVKNKPGRIFGVPSGAAAITTIRDYNDYADAQLMRQKIASCYMAFVKTDDTVGSGDDPLEKVEPGSIHYLSPGEEVTFGNPPAAEGYNEYSRGVLSSISAGFKTTYESMTNDLSNVNFSSGRMGWIEAYKNYEHIQYNVVTPKMLNKIWEWFRQALYLWKGYKNIPLSVNWTPPARQMIDPVKETNGLKEQVRAGFISYAEAVRSRGYQPDELMQEAKEYADKMDEYGFKFTSDARYDPSRKDDEQLADKDQEDD